MNDIAIPAQPVKRKRTRVRARVGSGSMSTTVCMSKFSECKRVSRAEAEKLNEDGWFYAPRSFWKKHVRDVKGYSAPVVEQKEVKKKAKKVKTDKPRKGKENKA